MENRLKGLGPVLSGRQYEDTVADYFIKRGWKPQIRFRKYNYEYDLYDKRGDDLSGDHEYLVVECKSGDRVSAKEVLRFINKVEKMYRHLPEIGFEKPKLRAYLCYAGAIDKDAETMVKNHKNPSITLKPMARKSK